MAAEALFVEFAKSAARIVLGVAIGIPLLMYPLLYFLQENLLFYPRSLSKNELQQLRQFYPKAEVSLDAPGGIRLHGWFHRPVLEHDAPLLIYFGGNAEELSMLVPILAQEFPQWALVLINYRGYGLSEGKPGEAALFADAEYIYDYFSKTAGVDKTRIVVMGRSLGSGVAVHVAETRTVKGVVLISAYDSIRALARERYPFAPVKYLLKHPFDSLRAAPSIKVPLRILAAREDTLIPPVHSQRLLEAWGGPAEIKILSGAGHNSISAHELYWPTLRRFMDEFRKS